MQATPPSRAPLPDRVDVVIVGGGIIGCSAAYFLAKRGVQVALCEKGRIAGEQSSRNWGFVRQQGRDAAEVPAIIESLRIWRGLEAQIGEDVGFHQGGVLYMADTEEHMSQFEAWLEIAKQYQLDTRLLSRRDVQALLPGATGGWAGAMHTPSDGRAEPAKATPAIARAAERHGASIISRCAVRSLDLEGGRVAGVVTEHGRIRSPVAVCAAGAWSSLFSGNAGVRLPQLKTRASVFRTEPAPEITEGAIWSSQAALRRRQDGGYTVAHGSTLEHPLVPDTFRQFRAFWGSFKLERRHLKLTIGKRFVQELTTPRRWSPDAPTPFESCRVLDPEPNRRTLEKAEHSLRQLFPALRAIKVAERWAGLIDVTPDAIPVISPVAGIEGFYLATGFSGHGFGIGPGAGKLVAEMVTGAPATVDMTPFRFERFAGDIRLAPTTEL